MEQYVIIARDGKDENALARRMEARPSHLDKAKELKSSNNLLTGGAMLDEDGNMCGSVMIVQFESKKELEEWLAIEPYINGKVWENYEVQRFRAVNL
jgi:uncharacterized protein